VFWTFNIPLTQKRSYNKFINQYGASAYNYINTNGTGFQTSYVYAKDTELNSYLGLGLNILDLDFELGATLGLSPYATSTTTFYRNNAKTGLNAIDFKSSAVFLSVNIPIALGFGRKEKTPKPPKAQKPKPEPKPEKKEDPKPKKEEKPSYDFKDKKLRPGDDLILNNINFEQSKSVLLPEGMTELDEVFKLMKQNPDIDIELSGHTSNEGDKKDNISLSKDRALACKEYLVNKGIKSGRIKAVGYGPNKPLSSSNQKANRRVEIKILE
jgi:outer membrane protein OmpA-like peptidoglycan-associated protein